VTWLALAPLSALGTLLDQSIPYAITSLGHVATMLLLVPASLTVINLVLTMHGRWTLVFGPGTAAFACVALAFLLATSLLEAIGSLRTVQTAVGLTDWQRGAWLWLTYGTFTFAAFAFADHAVPRMFRRAWNGGPLAAAALWLTWVGTTIAGLALMGGGMAESSLLAAGTTPEEVTAQLLVYRGTAFLGFGMVATAGLAFLTNLFLAYTSGAPAEYVVPGSSASTQPAH
jgi:cbb3-type cytochrome oxidase subunit 1